MFGKGSVRKFRSACAFVTFSFRSKDSSSSFVYNSSFKINIVTFQYLSHLVNSFFLRFFFFERGQPVALALNIRFKIDVLICARKYLKW